MKQTKLWMLATILTFCGAMAVSLTSCDKDDDTDKYEGPGPLAGMLKGTWYSIYDANGTAQRKDARNETVDYCIVIDVYNFDEKGTGTFQRCFFDEEASPELVQGILGYGDFTYASTAVATPAWVINYPSAYFSILPFSDDYRENATFANVVTINWLSNHTGSVGIIYMDFAGMDMSPNYTGKEIYETAGMKLVDSVIKQNRK